MKRPDNDGSLARVCSVPWNVNLTLIACVSGLNFRPRFEFFHPDSLEPMPLRDLKAIVPSL